MNNFRIVSAVIAINVLGCCLVMAKALDKSNDIEFKSALDQTVQKYILRLPVDFNDGMNHDLLIAFHGHGSDRVQFADHNLPPCLAVRDVASERNMIFVSPDYRATTSWMGPAAEADMVQIIDELKTKYKINKVFLCGGSMGGSSALTFGVLHPDMVAGVAAMNPTANHLEFTGFQDAIAQSFGGTKKDIPAEYKKRSAEYWPEKINFPVGITVGGKDTAVPPESALRFADILLKLGKDICLVNREQTEHVTSYDDARKILEYVIDTANKADASKSQKTQAVIDPN